MGLNAYAVIRGLDPRIHAAPLLQCLWQGSPGLGFASPEDDRVVLCHSPATGRGRVAAISMGRGSTAASPSGDGRLGGVPGVPLDGDVEEILQKLVAVLGSDAFGMELHAMHRMFAMG